MKQLLWQQLQLLLRECNKESRKNNNQGLNAGKGAELSGKTAVYMEVTKEGLKKDGHAYTSVVFIHDVGLQDVAKEGII